MGDRPLVIYGAGDHGLVVADAAQRSGREVLGFLDDQLEPETLVGGLPVLAIGYDESVCEGADVIVAVGENATRLAILDRIIEAGASTAWVVHPTAVVSKSAMIESGVFVGPRVIVNALGRLGRGVIVNSGAIIEHHVCVEEGAHIAPGAVLTGRVHVGARSLVGAGAVLLPGVAVENDVTIGAGSVVLEDVPDHRTVVGNPARPI